MLVGGPFGFINTQVLCIPVSHVHLHCVYVFWYILSDTNKALYIAVMRSQAIAMNTARVTAVKRANLRRRTNTATALAGRMIL